MRLIDVSATCWAAAFLVYAATYAPRLWKPGPAQERFECLRHGAHGLAPNEIEGDRGTSRDRFGGNSDGDRVAAVGEQRRCEHERQQSSDQPHDDVQRQTLRQ